MEMEKTDKEKRFLNKKNWKEKRKRRERMKK